MSDFFEMAEFVRSQKVREDNVAVAALVDSLIDKRRDAKVTGEIDLRQPTNYEIYRTAGSMS